MKFSPAIKIWIFTLTITIDLFDLNPGDRDIGLSISLRLSW